MELQILRLTINIFQFSRVQKQGMIPKNHFTAGLDRETDLPFFVMDFRNPVPSGIVRALLSQPQCRYSAMHPVFRSLISVLLPLLCMLNAGAQPKMEFQMKKPKQFEDRKLGSEKMADKKFTIVRRFFQNSYTHYNYFFLANQKINGIIDFATRAQKDDYTELLPFYPYRLSATQTSSDIDSVLQMVTSGILLHDLRNDWVDNLYLLMGKAYLLRTDYDSAMMAFQFLNYSYAPKEKGGFDRPIGSNATEGGNALSISSREKRNLVKKVLSRPPSRNESFIWMIRTLTEQGNYLDAASLVSTLRNDPVFPERLKSELAEVSAYLYYATQDWDSAAVYTEKSIDLSENIHDKARRYFLAGQLYQLAGKSQKASEAFLRSSKTAVDPVMDIYARLNTIRLRKSSDPGIIDQNIGDLKDLAKKDGYRNYRDIIYYAAALFETERDGYEAANQYLASSIASNTDNAAQRSQSFLLMGDVRYAAGKYGAAAQPYDSVNTALVKNPDSLRTILRKPGCKVIDEAEKIIYLQDSLLKIAALEETERTKTVRELARKLRREKGLKEDAASGTASIAGAGSDPAATDLFGAGKGTWYFYDPSRRSNGFNTFRERFGDRPNVDNWRRMAAISSKTTGTAATATGAVDQPAAAEDSEKYDTSDISFDNLYSRLPLTPEKQLKANLRITQAMFQKAEALHEQIEDYPMAIKMYEAVVQRTDSGQLAAQSLFGLIHAYTKTGQPDLAEEARKRLKALLAKDSALKSVKLMADTLPQTKGQEKAATDAYQRIYQLFLEGAFDKALALKKEADSTYGSHYWSAQLMYIEMVYYLQQKEDSVATLKLKDIISRYPNHPLAPRAKLLLEVLPKRKEIEAYLNQLNLPKADSLKPAGAVTPPRPNANTGNNAAPAATAATGKPSSAAAQAVPAPPPAAVAIPVKTQPETPPAYRIAPNEPFAVAIVLPQIDPAYVNEVNYALSNAPQTQYAGGSVTTERIKLTPQLSLIVLRSPAFNEATAAIQYITYLQPLAAKQILSWLDVRKYRFLIISEENLNLLKQTPEIERYEQDLKKAIPGKF